MKKGVPVLRTTFLSFASNRCDVSDSAANKILANHSSIRVCKFPTGGGFATTRFCLANTSQARQNLELDVITGNKSDRPSRSTAGQKPKARDQLIGGLLGRAHTT